MTILFYSSGDSHIGPHDFIENPAIMVSFWVYHHGKRTVDVPRPIKKLIKLRNRNERKKKKKGKPPTRV